MQMYLPVDESDATVFLFFFPNKNLQKRKTKSFPREKDTERHKIKYFMNVSQF